MTNKLNKNLIKYNKKKLNNNQLKINKDSNLKNNLNNNNNLLFNSKSIVNIKSIFENMKKISLKSLLINLKTLNLEKEVKNEIRENKNLESINLNQNRKIKDKNFIFQNNIRKFINSKFSFNSKIIKYLSTNNNYNFIKYNKINNSIKNNINELLRISFFFMSSLISKPNYMIKSDKIIINFFYLIFNTDILKNNNTKSVLILENNNKLRIICNYLSYFLKKHIELNLIRLYYPYYNSNILVNFFGIVSNKIKLRKIINSFLSKAIKNKVL